MGRDVTSRDGSRSGSGDMIIGFHSGNGIMRVSPDNSMSLKQSSVKVKR